VWTDVTQAFPEAMESSGERSLVSRRLFTIVRFARVVGHAFDTCGDCGASRCSVALEAGRTIRTAPRTCQESLLVQYRFVIMTELPVRSAAAAPQFGLRASRPWRRPGGLVVAPYVLAGRPAGSVAPLRGCRGIV
jgi:hypothetical protein